MKSIVEKARKIVTQLYERNMVSWNDLDREVVFAIQALNAEVQRMEALAQPEQEQEPVAIEYWLQDTMESGRWVTTGNMSRAAADDYCEVYPQGRIVEPSPPQRTWVDLSDEEIQAIAKQARSKDHAVTLTNKFLREKNT